MAHALLMLAMHPEMQEKVFQEVRSVGGDGELSYEDVAELTYTEMVLKETLRLFPPAPLVARLIKEPTKVRNATLPPSTICMVPIYKLHRSRLIWGDDAGLFDPERFSPERSGDADKYYFMPFAAGARNCIAPRYAMISMKVFLYHLMSQYSFRTDMKFEELKFSYFVVMKMINKYEITAQRREAENGDGK